MKRVRGNNVGIDNALTTFDGEKKRVLRGENNETYHNYDKNESLELYRDETQSLMHVPRTSSLPSPIMQFTGHTDVVNGITFSNNGNLLASCRYVCVDIF